MDASTLSLVIVLVFLIAFVVVFTALGIKIVTQASAMIVERLGRYNRTLKPGVNIIWPVFEKTRSIHWKFTEQTFDGKTSQMTKIVDRIDLREAIYDFPRQNVITKDNVVIEINALLYFQITNPVKAIYEIANLPDAIEKLTQTTLRNVIGEMELDLTLSSRDTINNKLRVVLDEAAEKWGVKVNRVELQDIIPPMDIKTAMEKQMRAERDKRASILEAEGSKQAKILESEGIKESEINKAEGNKKSTVLIAEGEAEARVKVAQAEAEAMDKITKAIAASKGDPAAYMLATKYIEALKEMVTGKDNKVIYIPYEATGMLSSIGSIKEMFTGNKK